MFLHLFLSCSSGGCASLGLSGCCTFGSCSPDGICFCDAACHSNGDCCSDIEVINCFPSTATSNLCVDQNFTECCTGSLCSSGDETCFCDQNCYTNGDCCADIEEINCFPATSECMSFNESCFILEYI